MRLWLLPCFSSTSRRRLKTARSPSEERPRGSQKPTGGCTLEPKQIYKWMRQGEFGKENSERDFFVNLFPNTGSSVFTCRWLKATYHRKFCEMQSKLRAEHLAHLRTHLRIRRDTPTNESCALADMLPIYSTSHLLWQTMCKLTVKLTDTGWAKLRRGESV